MNPAHYKKLLPKLIFRNSIEQMVFSSIVAHREHGVSVKDAIHKFQKFWGLTEDQLPTDSTTQSFYRMTFEFLDPKMRSLIEDDKIRELERKKNGSNSI